MDRRNFIKNTALCTGSLLLGCAAYKTLRVQDEAIISFKSENLPKRVTLETCTLCQLNCVKCWRSVDKNRMPLGYLKFENFKRFVDKNTFIEYIDITRSGEIFLNPDLEKIIKYAYEKNVKLAGWAGVNLNAISDKIAELLVKCKFENLIISIDGASQDVYSIYRRGGNFNQVIENIKKIQYYQHKYNDYEHPKLEWKFIVFGHNEHEIPKAKAMAKKLNIPIKFDVNFASDYSPVKDIAYVKKETDLNYFSLNEDDSKYNYPYTFYQKLYEKYEEDKLWFHCTDFYDGPHIFFDGKLLGCCLANYKKAPNVNVFKKGLKEALENPEVKKVINAFEQKGSPKGTMCENCNVLRFMKDQDIKLQNC